VRRVLAVGSRARGDARPESDLDLAVVVEPPGGGETWGPADDARERARLQAAVGAAADVMLTTTDMLAAGRRVFGGVEWLVDHEGVLLRETRLRRKPVARRSPDQVRRGYVATWLDHAWRALRAAQRGTPSGPAGEDPAAAAVLRALMALLVFHRLPAAKRDGHAGMLARLAAVDPPFAEWAGRLDLERPSPQVAGAVIRAVVERVAGDAGTAPYVAHLRRALAHPQIVIG